MKFQVLIVGIVMALAGAACAQQSARVELEALLPNAPSALLAFNQSTSSSAESGRLHGRVVDATGASINHGHAQLVDASGKKLQDVECGGEGVFQFENLPAGSYRVVVSAPNFLPFTSAPIVLASGQSYELPVVTLVVGGFSSVQVRADDPAIAEAEMKAATQQRLIGIVPNFYTSFEYNAVRLTTKQKYRFALRDAFDPFRFVAAGIGAGIQQARNTYPDFGQGMAGYGRRYGANFGVIVIGDMLSHAVYPSIFKQDPRYFYQGTGTKKSRFVHAISYAIVLRGDNGKVAPNYSHLLGGLSTGAIANVIYPAQDRGAGLLFTNMAISIGGRAGGGLMREFVAPYFTRRKAGRGKPPEVAAPTP